MLNREKSETKAEYRETLSEQKGCDVIYSHNFDCKNIKKAEIPVMKSEELFGEAHSAVSMFAAIQLLTDKKCY